jgi:hypothetical protein
MRRKAESSTKGMPRFLLLVAVLIALVLAIGIYLFYSPGKATSIEHPGTSSLAHFCLASRA